MFKAVMKLFRSLTTLLLGLTTAASVALAAPTGLGAGSAGTGSPFAGGQPKTVTVQLVSRQTAGIPRATNDIGILLKHEPGWSKLRACRRMGCLTIEAIDDLIVCQRTSH